MVAPLKNPGVLAVLIGARQYLERGWVQGAAAVNAEGTPCSGLAPQARGWCLTEAVRLAAAEAHGGLPMDRGYRALADAALAALVPDCLLDDRKEGDGGPRLVAYNDHPGRTQAVVLAAVAATIKRLESFTDAGTHAVGGGGKAEE